MADSKKSVFQPPPKAEQFPPKFHRLVLGLIELIDAKGIDVAQGIWDETVRRKFKNRQKLHFLCF